MKLFNSAPPSCKSANALRKHFLSLGWALACLGAAIWPACQAAAQSGVAYIANTTDNTVSVISVADQTFQLTIAVGSKPTGVATNSTYAYVTNSGDNTVSVINTSNNTVVNTLTVGSNPVAVAANDSFAYVVNAGNGAANGTVSVINVGNNTVLASAITVGKSPGAVAIAPAPNSNVYVTNSADATVSVISNNSVIQTVSLKSNSVAGVAPAGFTVGDNSVVSVGDFQFGYVTDPGAAGIWVLDLPSSPTGTVTVDSFVASSTGDVLSGLAGIAANDVSQTVLAANSASINPATVAQFDYSQETLGSGPAFVGDISLTNSDLGTETQPEQLAFTNGTTGYAYAIVTTPGTNNAVFLKGFFSGSGSLGLVNKVFTTGKGPSGVSVTPNNPTVCAFSLLGVQGAPNPIYSCSTQTCPSLPSVIALPSAAQLNAIVECEASTAGGSQSMALTFGAGTTCTLSGGGNEGNQCSATGTTLGGGTTFPATGVFSVQGSGVQGGSSSGMASIQTQVGTNCQLSVSPNPVIVTTNEPVSASISCTAPTGDNLSGMISWGDGTAETVSNVGGGTTPVTLINPSGAVSPHSYSTAQNTQISVTVTDLTEKAIGSVTPPSVPVTVSAVPVPPVCTFSISSTQVQFGMSVTASLSCSATVGDTLSGAVDWGDGTSSTAVATASASGPTIIPFAPHTYSAAGTFTASASLTDTTTNLPATISPASFQVTTGAPTLTPSSTNVPVAAGQSASVTIQFAGGPPNVTFNLSCQGLPQGASCSFNPITLTLNNAGAGSVQVTVSTTGPSASLLFPRSEHMVAAMLPFLLGMFGVVFLYSDRSRRGWGKRNSRVISAAVILLAMFGSGCGSTVTRTNTACSNCTPSGSYQITVMATSTKPVLSASTVFTITVGQ